jgi:hypothetical protein
MAKIESYIIYDKISVIKWVVHDKLYNNPIFSERSNIYIRSECR